MSERPASDAMLIAELYGWKWNSDYDTFGEVLPAIEAVLEGRDDLVSFCRRMRDYHRDTDTGYGPRSWRDFRNFTARPALEREFDHERLYYEIEGQIRATTPTGGDGGDD